jgi:preprotein translocase subunit SecE
VDRAAVRRMPSITDYIQQSRSELRKVHWPTREETIQLTTAVIFMVVVIGAFLGIVDQLFILFVQALTGGK